jgi:hypothetical protein
MKPGKPSTNPMKEGRPEPFPEPRTIPTGWDMSEFFEKTPEENQKVYHQDVKADEENRDHPAIL